MKKYLVALVLGVCVSMGSLAQAATVWVGPDITFTKDAHVDWTLEANQDFLTSNVTLARSDVGPLCNPTAGDPCTDTGGAPGIGWPTDTEWAVGTINDWDTLSYTSFILANDSQIGQIFSGRTFVVHLITDDIYLELTGIDWGNGGQGNFSYSRTTAVPIPAAVWLFGSGLAGLGWLRRKPTV